MTPLESMNAAGFDKWSGDYDDRILKLQDKGYPFQGYYDTLRAIQAHVVRGEHARVLDIGIGTGLLTHALYQRGCSVIGIDFSREMLDQAQLKMPTAQLIQSDLNKGLPESLLDEQFDVIISAYTMHHFEDDHKFKLVESLLQVLSRRGSILLGDIAFESWTALDKVKSISNGWDDAEHYMVASEILPRMLEYNLKARFIKTSASSGVFVIQPV